MNKEPHILTITFLPDVTHDHEKLVFSWVNLLHMKVRPLHVSPQKTRQKTRPFFQRPEAQYRKPEAPRRPYRQPDQQRGPNVPSVRRPFQLRRRWECLFLMHIRVSLISDPSRGGETNLSRPRYTCTVYTALLCLLLQTTAACPADAEGSSSGHVSLSQGTQGTWELTQCVCI